MSTQTQEKKGSEADAAAKKDEAPLTKSEQLFDKAKQLIPGGVNSPVRSCQAVHSYPRFMAKADAAYLFDVDGNEYIDFIGSWGAMILGHRHPRVLEAIEDALLMSTSFGCPNPLEVTLSELISQAMPSIEMVRMVNSGTEACMSAIRLARAHTGRPLVVKFDGCYHGHADSFLSKSGSGVATLGIAGSPGVPEEVAKLTVSLPFNDLDALTKAFKEHKDRIACIIVEPVVGNSGLILPADGYLAGLRELCTSAGALLIFDEVMTGFRVAYGGAQKKYEVKPDLTCLGKIIGGGLPVGAFGGSREIMERIAPCGDVYQAGTHSGNPVSASAGIAHLQSLRQPGIYDKLEQKTREIAEGIQQGIKEAKVQAHVVWTTGMLSIFLTDKPIADFAATKKCDTEKFARLWQELLKRGIYWPPSQFESAFVCLEHNKTEIAKTIAGFKEALKEISGK